LSNSNSPLTPGDWYNTVATNLANVAETVLGDNEVALTTGQVALLQNNFVAWLQANDPPPFNLSNIQPDFELILMHMMHELSTSDAWSDQITSGTGQALLRFMSGGTTMAVFACIRALQETMLPTAKLASSVFSITRMLGVHLMRKTPAQIIVQLNYSAPETFLEIPPLTQFMVGNVPYFNRDSIIFNQEVLTQGATLYQGLLQTSAFVSDGTYFQQFNIGLADFSTSDTDVYVFVDNVEWDRVTNGLWHYQANDQVWFDSTYTDGTVFVQFGNNAFGDAPSTNTSIQIIWAQCTGDQGNQLANSQTISAANFPTISGISLTTSTGGDNERDAAFYQIMAPYIYAANNRAVTAEDYRAIACLYPGVKDALFLGQAFTIPHALERMCVVDTTILTATDWEQSDWLEFVAYMQTYGIVNIQLLWVAAQAIIADITINLFCDPAANDLTAINSVSSQALINMLSPGVGSLGWSMYHSDIEGVVKKVAPQIKYSQIISPNVDVLLGPRQWIRLGKLTVNSYYSTRSEIAPPPTP
jgi:hypothetical protein